MNVKDFGKCDSWFGVQDIDKDKKNKYFFGNGCLKHSHNGSNTFKISTKKISRS